jgi:hypothetical protein
MRLTPTGAGPADFAQDEHARAEGSGMRTFVMRMDRVEPAQEASLDDRRDERREPTLHGRSLPAPASPELLLAGMHDPGSDSTSPGDAGTTDGNPTQPDSLDAMLDKLHAHRLSDDTRELSPTQMAIKARLIAQVIEANPTASHAFLQGFSPRQLRLYLDSLTIAKEPRGTVRRRGKGTPAIEAYRPSA